MPKNPVWAFALRTLLWLAPCFGAWYLLSGWHGRLAGELARMLANLYSSGLVTGLEFGEKSMTFATSIAMRVQGRQASLLVDVNPLIYTFGLPLLLALMLAGKARWWHLLVGAIALLPFQAWSIAFDVLKQVAITSGHEAAVQIGLSSSQRDFVALAYQLGALIFPTLAPVLLWGLLERRFIAERFAKP